MKLARLNNTLFLIFLWFSFAAAQTTTNEQFLKVLIRNVGHNFLLELEDSSMRVLPIENLEGSYVMKFEHDLSFYPEQLYTRVQKVLSENNSTESFIVEVKQCGNFDVLYSFKASPKENEEILTCKGRKLPLSCYEFYFTLTSNQSRALSAAADDKTINYLSFFLLVLFLAGLFFFWKWKKKDSKEESKLLIGKYEFDPKRMKLVLEDEVFELSALESNLLELFIQNKNETLKREYILNEIWEDEGNYVGRTLDVFISKLRKKLEKDESLKIVSVRGVGYKFVN